MESLLAYMLIIAIITLFFSYPSYALKDETNKSNLHFNSIIVDGHNDTMMKVIDKDTWLPKIDIGKDTNNHIDIPN